MKKTITFILALFVVGSMNSQTLKFHFTFDEKLTDESVNNYVLTPGATTVTNYTEGKYGNAILLNGVNEYFDLNATGVVNPATQSLTACAWVLNTQTPDQRQNPLSATGFDEEQILHIKGSRAILQHIVNNNESNIASWVSGGELKSTGTNCFTVNEWQHVAVVSDPVAKTHVFYVNGIQVGDPVTTTNTGWSTTTGGYRIGAHQLGDRSFWHGKIDEVCLFEGKLTVEQLNKVMNNNFIIDTSTSASYTQSVDIQLFPNPVKDRLTVTGSDSVRLLTLMSLQGRILENSSSHSIELSKIASGNYVLKIELFDGTSMFKKVVVNN
jgi:hypothetical protein